MTKAEKLLDEVGPQYRTEVANLLQGGSRHIRNTVEKAIKRCENMMNPKVKSPNPANLESYNKLENCVSKLRDCIGILKEVKDSAKPFHCKKED